MREVPPCLGWIATTLLTSATMGMATGSEVQEHPAKWSKPRGQLPAPPKLTRAPSAQEARPLRSGASIYKRVRDIVASQLEVPPSRVTLDARFAENLKVDSLGVVELVLALEEIFQIDIPDEDTESLRTVGDLVNYLQLRTSKIDTSRAAAPATKVKTK